MGQPLEEVGCSALLELGRPMDDKVFLEAGRADLGAFEGEHDARIATDVAQLLLLEQVARNELIAVEPAPRCRSLAVSRRDQS